jgi:hypothetical protein
VSAATDGHLHLPAVGLRRIAGAALLVPGLIIALALAPGARAAEAVDAQALAPSPVPLTSMVADPTSETIYALQYEGTRLFSYDPVENTWSELPEAPETSGNNGGATYLNGKIYTSSVDDGESVGVYDIATREWSQITNPLGAGTADITSGGEEIYMAGASRFIRYNPVTERTTTLPDPPVFAPAGCAGGYEPWGGLEFYKGRIYGDQGNGCRGFAEYDIATERWTELALTPLEDGASAGPVAGSALDPVSGSFFAYGGYEGDDFFEYGIAAASWSTYTLPFNVNDGGLAYLTAPGVTGVYAIQGQEADQFIRFTRPEPVAPAPAPPAATSVPVTPTAPSPLRCTKRTSATLHWKLGRRPGMRRIVITLNGIVYERLPASARSAVISLAGTRAATVVVRITATSSKGRPSTKVRVFHLCKLRRATARRRRASARRRRSA